MSELRNKKILVTGGAGFIGSNLCERLVQDNEVLSIDNYFTGSIDNHIAGVTYINSEAKDIESALTNCDFKPDIIYHLGEYSRVEQSYEDVGTVLNFNMDGIKAVLEYVRKNKCKLIYAGSSTKYSDIGKNGSPYAWSKATNTELVKNYGEWFNIDYAITYFYNVYGNREIKTGKYCTLIAKFCELYKNNSDFPIVSPGTQKRNFTHIDDTIDALVLIGLHGRGDEYGIGASEAYSILEIAEMFYPNLSDGSNEKIVMLPERSGNRMSAEVITTKTEELGWKQQRKLKDYINENIHTNLYK